MQHWAMLKCSMSMRDKKLLKAKIAFCRDEIAKTVMKTFRKACDPWGVIITIIITILVNVSSSSPLLLSSLLSSSLLSYHCCHYPYDHPHKHHGLPPNDKDNDRIGHGRKSVSTSTSLSPSSSSWLWWSISSSTSTSSRQGDSRKSGGEKPSRGKRDGQEHGDRGSGVFEKKIKIFLKLK